MVLSSSSNRHAVANNNILILLRLRTILVACYAAVIVVMSLSKAKMNSTVELPVALILCVHFMFPSSSSFCCGQTQQKNSK